MQLARTTRSRSLVGVLALVGLLGLASTTAAQSGLISGLQPQRDKLGVKPPPMECLSFEGFQAGQRISLHPSGLGPVAIAAFNPSFGPANAALIFDSSNPTGLDFDLGTPNQDFGGPGVGIAGQSGSPYENAISQRNLLIIAENLVDGDNDGLVDDPDDADLVGMELTFDFSGVVGGEVEIRSFFIIDGETERPASTIDFYAQGGALLTSIVVTQPGDNGVIRLSPNVQNVERMVMRLNGSTAVDDVCFREMIDCNDNGRQDHLDIKKGDSSDCNGNGIPDECEPDCDSDGIPDDCEPDCDGDGIPDDCDGPDCDGDGIPDECDAPDCNGNGIPDNCDIDGGASMDADGNGVPDECDPDCDMDGVPDSLETDCDSDGTPDDCEPDCDEDGVPDDCETDTDGDGIPDDCEVCTGAIGNFVWNDIDRDGIQDPSEPGIEGVTLELKDAMGAVIDAVVTGRLGEYLFSDLCAGDYTVCVDETTLPPDFVPSPCNVGADDTLDNDCSPKPVNLPTDESVDLTNDFGYNSPCSGMIGDFVWHDVDGDGIQDAGEPGIEGVCVILKDHTGAEIAQVTTGPFGFYTFMGLCGGLYTVCVEESTLPPGFVPSPCNDGVDDTVDNDCSPADVLLPNDDAEDLDTDFGYNSPCSGTIGDFVWDDVNADGIQAAGELGMESIVLTLKDALGNELASTTTGPNGEYSFEGLCAGTYVVCVDETTLPPDYVPSVCNAGTDDTLDNDCSPLTVVLPTDDTDDPTIDFGYHFDVPGGGQGCTPGYWKQSHHFDSWPLAYSPDTLFGDVFEDAFPGMTLVEVLGQGGGGLNALGRHIVAGLLNAASGGVSYDVTVAEVLSLFNGLFPASTPEYNALKNYFENFNEQGCPLN